MFLSLFPFPSNSALDILEEINLSIGRKNNFSEVALDKIYDHNLPQKYSQVGYLAPNNIILDGFYDYGKVKCFKLSASFCLDKKVGLDQQGSEN